MCRRVPRSWRSPRPHEAAQGSAARGVIAALGAGVLWGTMYIPYRKAYLTGMSPLAFVTFFTVGELGLHGHHRPRRSTVAPLPRTELAAARGVIFWLMLGGFIWVIGDLFQQYAAKYVGISRGIPALEHQPALGTALGDAGLRVNSGATAAPCPSWSSARSSWRSVRPPSPSPRRETRSTIAGGMPPSARRAAMASTSNGSAPAFVGTASAPPRRSWIDWTLVAISTAVFVFVARLAEAPALAMDLRWVVILCIVTVALLAAAGWVLWRTTRFN